MSLDLRFDIEQNSAALFAGLMAAARDGVLLLDAVGQIICLNAAGAKLGRENETPLEIGRNWLALWSADQQDLLQTALDQVFEGGQSQVTLPDPAQSQASLDLSLSPIRDDRGEVVYALATICLSEQGELSHLRQELATLRGELDQLRQAQQAAQDLETDRLEALSATHLMDSPQEARFDELTQLAATALNVKTALISLVEKDRQWFKSRVNFDTTETPRKVSFCSIAIETPDQVMVVEDARTDPRVCANPLVHSGPQIGFYAGAPLVTSEGYALGTLCVIDTEPRQFSERERQVLKTIAATVMTEIELAIQKRERDALDVINMELRHR
ncbi:MAG: GAF domain-containing protein, partial [Mangrovicoccus sp.]